MIKEALNIPQPDPAAVEASKLVDAAFGALERAILGKGLGNEDVVRAVIMLRATHVHLGVLQAALVETGVLDATKMNLALAKAFADAAKELSAPQLAVVNGNFSKRN